MAFFPFLLPEADVSFVDLAAIFAGAPCVTLKDLSAGYLVGNVSLRKALAKLRTGVQARYGVAWLQSPELQRGVPQHFRIVDIERVQAGSQADRNWQVDGIVDLLELAAKPVVRFELKQFALQITG